MGYLAAALVIFVWGFVKNDNAKRHMHYVDWDPCSKLFGLINRPHVQDTGYYYNAPGYGTISARATDGVGRKHGDVKVRCKRCDKNFTLVSVHSHGND